MGKTVLSKAQLAALPEIPAKIIDELKGVYKNYNAVLAQLLKCIKETVKVQIGDSDKWLTLSPRSQEQVLSLIFSRVRDIMKVASPDGSGMPLNTFNTYCTTIKRCLLFHCTIEDARRHANYALRDAFIKALQKKKGTLEQRMTTTLDECRNDPSWVGHPKPIAALENQAAMPLNEFALPASGIASTPQHLIKLVLQVFLENIKREDIKEALKVDDVNIKECRTLIAELREVYSSISDSLEEKKQAA